MQWYCQTKLFNAIVARLFNSPKHDYSTVNGTIFQLSVLQLFSSHWYHCSTVAGLIFHLSMARFPNSQCNFTFYCSGMIRFFNMIFTVRELCHVSRIRHLIQFWIQKKLPLLSQKLPRGKLPLESCPSGKLPLA